MDDGERYEDPQTFISCPYNVAHTFPKFRMARHLVKCRRQHEEESKEMKQCPFNANHVIPLIELRYHETVCADRESLYNYTHQPVDTQNRIVEELNKNTTIHLEVPASSENWDDEIDSSQDIISACRHNAESRGVLQSNSNEPPAERKALRMQQRMRERERMNLAEERSNNRQDDTRSMASYRTTTSASTDVTFNTARNTTEQYINRIPPSNGFNTSYNVSRGRGRVIPKQKPSEIGLGRGRQI